MVDAADYERLKHYSWHLNSHGYPVRKVTVVPGGRGVRRQRSVFLHRELLGLPPGDKRQGDHINRDKLDNRRSNLRVVTKAQQNQNKGSAKGSRSKYRGVWWNERSQKWQAGTRLNGRLYHHGYFTDEGEAGDAAARFREHHMPFSHEEQPAWT